MTEPVPRDEFRREIRVLGGSSEIASYDTNQTVDDHDPDLTAFELVVSEKDALPWALGW